MTVTATAPAAEPTVDAAVTAPDVDAPPAVTSSSEGTSGVLAGCRRMQGLPVVQALTNQSLTAPGGLLVALVVITPGVLVDLLTDATLGAPSTVSFLLAVLVTAAVVRRQALATAAVLPPLLFAGAATALGWLSGNNEGRRELVLDVGTTLALSAPALFAGTAAALAVALGRLCWGFLRR